MPGYFEFLEAISNPAHEEHESMLEWYGIPFDPQDFDIDLTNAQLKHIKL